MKRVAILGRAGAGKSTLARAIGEALDLPVIHLDVLVYGPEWARLPVASVRERLADLMRRDSWVVEGTYPELADLSLPRAERIIWIDQPAWLRLWRCWRKTRVYRTRRRPDRPEGCEERFSWSYLRAILGLDPWTKALDRELSRRGDRRMLRLRGDRAVRRFMSQFGEQCR